MATAPGSSAPDEASAGLEFELEERARHAQKMHHRQLLRRGLIAAFILGTVAVLSVVLFPVFVHIRTSWYLQVAGLIVNWQLDEENWTTGGVTTVDCNNRRWQRESYDRYLVFLPELLHLEELNLADCDISVQGLSPLAKLGELKQLNLARLNQFRHGSGPPGLGDDLVQALRGLSGLQFLTLSGHRITDTGLAILAKQHPKLEYLELDATDVGDAGIAALAELGNLKSVNLAGTRVSPEGMKKLLAARPGLEINTDIEPEVERQLQAWRRGKP